MRFRILHYDTLDSTNALIRALAQEGASEGTVVTAAYQTRGRGRFNRKWISRRGENLLFSILLRPNMKTCSASIVTHLAARSVQEVLIKNFDLPAKLKRPNDVLIHSKKIAGVLTEAITHGHRLEYMIVGIGLNVNSKPAGIPKTATSIRIETQKKARIDRTQILNDILSVFRHHYGHVLKNGVFAAFP